MQQQQQPKVKITLTKKYKKFRDKITFVTKQ